MIYSILDEDNNSLSCKTDDINKSIHNFWSKIYTKEQEDETLQEKLLKNIDTKLSNEDKNMLDEALSEQELFESLVSLKGNKSPGPDGLTK